MKKFLLLVVMACFAFAAQAQEKTAYADVYARGGGKNLKITILYNGGTIDMGRSDLGSALSLLGEYGWTVDEGLNVPNANMFFMFTRTKFHVVMKKNYKEGENPYKEIEKFSKKKDK